MQMNWQDVKFQVFESSQTENHDLNLIINKSNVEIELKDVKVIPLNLQVDKPKQQQKTRQKLTSM